MPHLSLFNYIKKVSDNMNKSCLGIIIAIIISFFVIRGVSAEEELPETPEPVETSVEVITSISVVESVEVVTSVSVVESVSVIESLVTVTEPVYTTAIAVPETEPTPEPEETTSIPALMLNVPEETSTVESSALVTTESYNMVLTRVVQELIDRLDHTAEQYDVDLVYPEDFEVDVAARIGFVMYDVYAAAHPELYRDAFILDVLKFLDITVEDDYYSIFFDVVGTYYDDVTGITETSNDNAVGTLILCSVGGIFIFTALKWIF